MFDLFRSREKSVRYILIALLSLVALSLVVTLIPGIGGGYQSSQDSSVIAEIGDEVITATELRQNIQRQMSGGQIPREMASIYVPLIAQQLIASNAVAYEATRLGFKLTDAEVAEVIRSVIPSLFQNGQFVGRDTYAAMLAQQNLTIPIFEANVRKQAAATKLEVLALEGMVVTPMEVEEAFRKKNDRIVVSYAALSQDQFQKQAAATPAEINSYFEARKASFMTPEKRSVTVYEIEESKIASTISLPEADLRAAYTREQDSFRTPDRVRVRHILLKTTDKPETEVALIQKRAEGLLKQIQGDADFAKLAQANSEDEGSAPRGGDIDWITKGQTVPEFEKTAFSLKPGELSGLVKTMYGFHILRVEGKEEARLKPFEEVKDELQKNLARARVFDKMQSLADQIRAGLVNAPQEVEKLAAENNINVLKAEKIARGEMIPGAGANQQFSEAIFALPKGGVTPAVTAEANKLLVGQVTDIVASRPSELAEVQDSIRQAIVADKAQKMLQEKVKEFGEKLKAANGDLASVAKQMGVEVKTTAAFNRGGSVPGIDTGARFEEGFRKQTGETFGPVMTPTGTLFCKVIEKQPADLTQLAAERDEIVKTLKSEKSRMRRELLYDGVVNALVKEKRVKVYEDAIKKIAASFNI